jgi:hypothetical protein
VATNGELAYGVDRRRVIGKPFKGEGEDKSRNGVNPFLFKTLIIRLFVGSIVYQLWDPFLCKGLLIGLFVMHIWGAVTYGELAQGVDGKESSENSLKVKERTNQDIV